MLERAAASKKIMLEETNQQFLKQAGIARFGEAEEIADLMASSSRRRRAGLPAPCFAWMAAR